MYAVSAIGWSKYWHGKRTAKGRKIFVGCFKDAIKAATAYDNKAKELFGEFARTNFR